MSDDHGHHHESPVRVLAVGAALSIALVLVEAITGIMAGSLALLSDAGHLLADSAGLLLALAAASAGRRPADVRRTYGYARFEVLAVPVHVTILLGIAGYIIFESVGRLREPQDIHTLPVIIVGVLGLIANLVVMRLLHGHSHDNLNVRGARLEAAADAVGSVGVIAAATFIAFGGWRGMDAVVGLVVVAFIVPRALSLLRQSADILLESAPRGLDPDAIVEAAQGVEGVVALHDVHVWSIAPRFPALSAHVEMDDVACTEHILTDVATMLREQFGIGHVTLQPETRELHEALNCCESEDAGRMAEHSHAGAR